MDACKAEYDVEKPKESFLPKGCCDEYSYKDQSIKTIGYALQRNPVEVIDTEGKVGMLEHDGKAK